MALPKLEKEGTLIEVVLFDATFPSRSFLVCRRINNLDLTIVPRGGPRSNDLLPVGIIQSLGELGGIGRRVKAHVDDSFAFGWVCTAVNKCRPKCRRMKPRPVRAEEALRGKQLRFWSDEDGLRP